MRPGKKTAIRRERYSKMYCLNAGYADLKKQVIFVVESVYRRHHKLETSFPSQAEPSCRRNRAGTAHGKQRRPLINGIFPEKLTPA